MAEGEMVIFFRDSIGGVVPGGKMVFFVRFDRVPSLYFFGGRRGVVTGKCEVVERHATTRRS
jgi:hypothetical protein